MQRKSTIPASSAAGQETPRPTARDIRAAARSLRSTEPHVLDQANSTPVSEEIDGPEAGPTYPADRRPTYLPSSTYHFEDLLEPLEFEQPMATQAHTSPKKENPVNKPYPRRRLHQAFPILWNPTHPHTRRTTRVSQQSGTNQSIHDAKYGTSANTRRPRPQTP